MIVTVTPRPLNERLWELHRKCADRTATKAELDELDAMCRALETEQDNTSTRGAGAAQ